MEKYYRWVSNELVKIATVRHGQTIAEIDLVVAIMAQAGKDFTNLPEGNPDQISAGEYLYGPNFEQDARLVGLNPDFTRILLSNLPPEGWNREDDLDWLDDLILQGGRYAA